MNNQSGKSYNLDWDKTLNLSNNHELNNSDSKTSAEVHVGKSKTDVANTSEANNVNKQQVNTQYTVKAESVRETNNAQSNTTRYDTAQSNDLENKSSVKNKRSKKHKLRFVDHLIALLLVVLTAFITCVITIMLMYSI